MAESEVILKNDLLERLQMKSESKGITPDELLEEFLNADDEEDRINEEPEMMRLADVFSDLVDICDDPETTDSVELRDMCRERRL